MFLLYAQEANISIMALTSGTEILQMQGKIIWLKQLL